MQRTPVQSSNLVSVGYDAETEVLEVEFKSGVYRYYDVPPEEYAKFTEAESLGRHMGTHIRGKYRTEKVAPEPPAEEGKAAG